jgi:inositol 1,4,5-triphosphate receptor type 1
LLPLQYIGEESRSGAKVHHDSCGFILQIVRQDRTLEQIVFPIPEICEYITSDTKAKILNTAERDDQGSKVSDFFERTEDMFSEMKWQKKLRGRAVSSPEAVNRNVTMSDCSMCQNSFTVTTV